MKRTWFLILLALGILLLLPTAAALAQGGDLVITGRVIAQEDESPVAGATVSIPALNLTAETDAAGRYTLTVPASALNGQSVEVRVVAPRFQSRTAPVTLAVGALTQDFSLPFGFQQEVTVGSRAMGAAAEKAVPVDVFTEEQIESATGTTETNQILQALTPRSTSPGPRSPTGPTRCARPRCAIWDRISSSFSSTASAGTRARWSTSTTPSAVARPAWT